MRPVLFHLPDWLPGIGDQPIPSYGVMMALGSILACVTFSLLVKASGKDGGKAFELLLETILVAMVASKVVGLLFQDPMGDVTLWERLVHTGGVWYVGFLAGVGWMALRGRALEMSTLSVLDHAACAVPVGHAFGRLGCFLAGCCYGGSCDLPWAVTYSSETAHATAGTPLGVALHPVQLYEMGGELLLAAFLCWWLLKKSQYPAQTGLLYLALYAILRFSLELLRDDHRGGGFGPFSTSQSIALMILAISVPMLIHGHRHGHVFPERKS